MVETKKVVDENTPEDTRTLLKNTKIEFAKKFGDTYSWSVVNEWLDYAPIVEKGVSWKKFQYNKPKWVAFWPKRQGARMFEIGRIEAEKLARESINVSIIVWK